MNIFFIFIFSINLILNTVTNQGLLDMTEMFFEETETATEETKDEFSESKTESTFEEDLLIEINNYRVKNKLEKLTFDKLLNELAKEHSEYMSERDDLSHDNFGERFKKSKKCHVLKMSVGIIIREKICLKVGEHLRDIIKIC